MLRKSIVLGLALLCAAPAFAPSAFADDHRGRGGRGNDHHDNRGGNDRHDNRGGNWNNNRHDNRDRNWSRNNNWNYSWNNNYRYYDRGHTSLSLGFIFGSPGYAGYSPYYDGYGYDGYSYREPAYYNAWGLAPGQCRWDRDYAYWRGRPADVEVRRCADSYGNVYVVQNSARLWRYR